VLAAARQELEGQEAARARDEAAEATAFADGSEFSQLLKE
jgi:hypothetical protein